MGNEKPRCWSDACDSKSPPATVNCAVKKEDPACYNECHAFYFLRFESGAGKTILARRGEQGEKGGRGKHSFPKTPG